MSERVSVVGLGKLGLGLALCIADSGFETIGVDVNETVVTEINAKRTPVIEPEYQELIAKLDGKFRATLSHAEAIEKTDITFVLVATPSIGDGGFSNRYVISALQSLAEAFGKSEKKNHLFVISSTVVPGSTDNEFVPLIEAFSGKKYRKDFDVCFDPDFVALGSVVKDFKNPDVVIIGESSPAAGKRVEAIHRQMCENDPKISRMSIISGEVAKVSLNAYITMKISFANTVANLCERIEGTDVDQITSAIGADRRISPFYFRGGLAFGGTCFPRDTKAFMKISAQYELEPKLISAVEDVNNFQKLHLAEFVIKRVGDERKVSILGIAFKDNTPVTEASPAIDLINELIKDDILVTIYDPLAMNEALAIFHDEVSYANSIEECLASSPVCVVTLKSENYQKAVENYKSETSLTIIDCWRQIDREKVDSKIKVYGIGRAESEVGETTDLKTLANSKI